eukprot:m.34905 g.34905  ORF g.34905 m.34905 type:complete len:278 (-) comp9966_c0_seq1:155-988(-)
MEPPYHLAFGTYLLQGDDVNSMVYEAIKHGYRHIDTASVYRNEDRVGQAIQRAIDDGLVTREELFVTTKLSPREQGYENAKQALTNSLERLNLGFVDCYLIHWPGVSKLQPDDPKNSEIRKDTWRALEELQREGKAKHIGVSNYMVPHLKELLSHCNIKPFMNQVELHPQLIHKELREVCAEEGVLFEAYSPLGCGHLLTHEKVVAIATKQNLKPAQLLLLWSLQRASVLACKSKTASRVCENFDVLSLPPLEDNVLEELDRLDEGKHYCWNPFKVA